MPDRPDLRQLAQSLRESLDGLTREALVDILTYVLNEYVVEGPPPLAAGQVESLEDLSSLNLAQLIGTLQTRLDTAGLDLFRVEGDQVIVQTPQGQIALRPGESRAVSMSPPPPEPAPARAPATPAPEPPRAAPRAGIQFQEQPMPPRDRGRASADEASLRGRGDLAGGEVGVITPPPPRPRGISISSRPAAQTDPAAPAAEPPSERRPPAQGAQSGQGQGASQQPSGQQGQQPPSDAKPSSERKDDDASIRFSLLELD